MNSTYRTYVALAGAVILAMVQYFIPRPWRYVVTSTEITILIVAVAAVWGRTKGLMRTTEEHQARLDAITEVASKAQVVRDANHLVDVITEGLYVHERRETIRLAE